MKKKSVHVKYSTALIQLPLVNDNPLTEVRTPVDVATVCHDMSELAQECFHILVLNSRNKLLSRCLISIGTLDSTIVHARDVFRQAILEHGSALVLCHNHPSGDPTPSAEDLRITRQLILAGQVLGIMVMDHIILGRKSTGNPGYLSLREAGICDFTGNPS